MTEEHVAKLASRTVGILLRIAERTTFSTKAKGKEKQFDQALALVSPLGPVILNEMIAAEKARIVSEQL